MSKKLLRKRRCADFADADNFGAELAVGGLRRIGRIFEPLDLIAAQFCFKQHVAMPAADLQKAQATRRLPALVQACSDLIELQRGGCAFDDIELGGKAIVRGRADEIVAAVDRSEFLIARLRILHDQPAGFAALDRNALDREHILERLAVTDRAGLQDRTIGRWRRCLRSLC